MSEQVNVSYLNEVISLQLFLDFISDFLQLLSATPNHLLLSQGSGGVGERDTDKVKTAFAKCLC